LAGDDRQIPKAWLHLPRAALDEIFTTAAGTRLPEGSFDGVLILPLGPLTGIAASLLRAFIWRGKIFTRTADAASGMVVNKVTPLALRGVPGQVYIGTSWIDAKDTIVIDYSRTSFIAKNIRDEIREVSPGVYLGKFWWRRIRIGDFALARVSR
jgi:hypothetical protein